MVKIFELPFPLEVAERFDGSQQRKALGRPEIAVELEALVVRMAQEKRSWGYDCLSLRSPNLNAYTGRG
jgi:hypothetical protein